ncbi:MAG: hypothetical protein H5U00_10615, partial [Clostridia bacterium]|nr:hypothetical protein [Clostridia bacterium]
AENNRFAALEIARRIGEAIRRGYLRCTDEELAAFQNAVVELEGKIEEKT